MPGEPSRKSCTLIVRVLLILILIWGMMVLPPLFVHAATISPVALTVYGQGGSFTTAADNTTATGLTGPRGVIFDSSGDIYILDNLNSRVLYYPVGSTTATRVYGQGGSFTTGTTNTGGISADSLNRPNGLILDSSGHLYIADSGNNRVLYYPAGSTTATRVYGQGGSFTTGTLNNGGISADSLYAPNGMVLDTSGNLYVTEYSNNRVLYYPAGSTTATRVYGQGGSFTIGTTNTGGISADSLSRPVGVALDSSGNLYIADSSNNRVLYYPAGSTMATRVYGHGGSFSSSSVNDGGLSADSLKGPSTLAVDMSGNLYIADSGNNRVLYYPAGSTAATRVYGQAGSFSSNTANNGGVSASSLSNPVGLSQGQNGNLYVSDSSNSRVLVFQTALSITTQPPASTGSPFTVVAQLIDVGSGLVFSDFTDTVSATIKAGTGASGATLSGGTSTASGGVATFSGLSINKNGAGYILTISSPGVASVNTNMFTVAGSLFFTPLTSPSFSFTLTGATGTITSTDTFKVKDTTGSGVGWHVTITSTLFTNAGGKTLPSTSTTITAVSAACTAGQTCVVPTNGISGYPLTVPAAATAPAAVSFFSANGGTGTGDVTITMTFSLNVPAGTASGTYTSTFTETLVKGQ